MRTSRTAPFEMNAEEFKSAGYKMIDQIAEFIEGIGDLPVTKGEKPSEIRAALGKRTLPENGTAVETVLDNATNLMFDHSLFNGHPKFWGYITASAAPIGSLGDLLASSVNANCGAFILSPMATEIEKQTVSWLAELIGYNTDCGGVLVSGGNMANFTGFLAGRTAKFPESIKTEGVGVIEKRMMIYCSKGTHTWIDKAASLFGHGTNSIRWIPTNEKHQMDNKQLESAIEKDIEAGMQPFMVIGTVGDVSMGVVDDLQGIAEISKKYHMWFHADGAYGVPAACLASEAATFKGLDSADSIALDPHKWLYAPLEAGCTLVKNKQHLLDTFSSHPEYYNFDKNDSDPETNFFEFGLQNSRGFRALKVWLMLQQVGRKAYEKMIGDDIDLAMLMFELSNKHPELNAVSHSLSITTFQYVPEDCTLKGDERKEFLNSLNEQLVDVLQAGGDVFVSNAVINGDYCLRACITNFRTTVQDCQDLIEIAVREGRKISENMH